MSKHWRPSIKHDLKENLLAATFAILSLIVVAYFTKELVSAYSTLYVTASMGAAAVLMFCVPSSPMASGWSFIAGNLISALIGISSFKLLGNDIWVAPFALGLSIACMSALRCLHPPGGATALLCLIGGTEIHELGYTFLLHPLGLNIAGMLLFVYAHRRIINKDLASNAEPVGYAQNNVGQPPYKRQHNGCVEPSFVIREDIDMALASLGQYVDVNPDQLTVLTNKAVRLSRARRLSGLQCGEIMLPANHSVEYGDSLLAAYHIMSKNHLSVIVVTDKSSRVEGILSLDQLFELADVNVENESLDPRSNASVQRILDALTPTNTLTTAKPECVGQVMAKVAIFYQEQPLGDVFENKDNRHQYLPVVDSNNRLAGLLDTWQLWRMIE